jgi:hypothetical protein
LALPDFTVSEAGFADPTAMIALFPIAHADRTDTLSSARFPFLFGIFVFCASTAEILKVRSERVDTAAGLAFVPHHAFIIASTPNHWFPPSAVHGELSGRMPTVAGKLGAH